MAMTKDASVWDYAYAAGFISKAEAKLISNYEIVEITENEK